MIMLIDFITDLTLKDISLGVNVLLFILLCSSRVAHFIHKDELKWRYYKKGRNDRGQIN